MMPTDHPRDQGGFVFWGEGTGLIKTCLSAEATVKSEGGRMCLSAIVTSGRDEGGLVTAKPAETLW